MPNSYLLDKYVSLSLVQDPKSMAVAATMDDISANSWKIIGNLYERTSSVSDACAIQPVSRKHSGGEQMGVYDLPDYRVIPYAFVIAKPSSFTIVMKRCRTLSILFFRRSHSRSTLCAHSCFSIHLNCYFSPLSRDMDWG